MASSEGGRRGGRGRVRRAAVSGISQLPWRRVQSPYPPMALLDPEQLEKIHLTSMRILEELGIEAMHPGACDLLERAGAKVDRATMTVTMDRDMVLELATKAPAATTLTPRNPGRKLYLGGRDIVTTLVAGPPAVHDRVRGRRPSNMKDYRNFIRLTQYFKVPDRGSVNPTALAGLGSRRQRCRLSVWNHTSAAATRFGTASITWSG